MMYFIYQQDTYKSFAEDQDLLWDEQVTEYSVTSGKAVVFSTHLFHGGEARLKKDNADIVVKLHTYLESSRSHPVDIILAPPCFDEEVHINMFKDIGKKEWYHAWKPHKPSKKKKKWRRKKSTK